MQAIMLTRWILRSFTTARLGRLVDHYRIRLRTNRLNQMPELWLLLHAPSGYDFEESQGLSCTNSASKIMRSKNTKRATAPCLRRNGL